MAVPIIDSITVVPPTINECETATITILAHETVEGDATLSLVVRNGLGQFVTRDVIIPMSGNAPLTYVLTLDPDDPGQVDQDPAHPNVFYYTAPCPSDPNHDRITHETHLHQ